MECVRCNGRNDGCESCKGTGVYSLTVCPWQEIDRPTLELSKYVKAAEKHLPLAGGLLDQTQSFVDAMDWINAEHRRWEKECRN